MDEFINSHFKLVNSNCIEAGDISFVNTDIGIKTIIKDPIDDKEWFLNSLYCLYFATFAHQIYEGKEVPDFPKESTVAINSKEVDYELLKTLNELVKRKFTDKDPEAIALLQSILFFVDRHLNHNLRVKLLMISLGFQVLLKLNPNFPEAGLRQELRPLLHMKFSKPVELLWKFVEQFYCSLREALMGQLEGRPFFDQNPNVHVPIDTIAEKLLIYTIYEKSGHFKRLHPETVMVLFWPQETLIKKFSLFEAPAEHQHQDEIAMLKSIWKKGKEFERLDKSSYHFDPLPQELESLFSS